MAISRQRSLPVLDWLVGYQKEWLAFDLIAGLVTAAVVIPKAMAYATIAGLYQALGTGVDRGIALTVAELALLPNVVIWAASWLLGPGFMAAAAAMSGAAQRVFVRGLLAGSVKG